MYQHNDNQPLEDRQNHEDKSLEKLCNLNIPQWTICGIYVDKYAKWMKDIIARLCISKSMLEILTHHNLQK